MMQGRCGRMLNINSVGSNPHVYNLRQPEEIEYRVNKVTKSPREFADKVIERCKLVDHTFLGFSGEWKGKLTRSVIQCNKHGSVYDVSSNSFYAKKVIVGCPQCRGVMTEEEATKFIEEKCKDLDYEFLGFVGGWKSQITKMILRCKKHDHIWKNTKFFDFKNHGTCGCKKCAAEQFKTEYVVPVENALSRIEDKCKKLGYEYIGVDGEWIGTANSWIKLKCTKHDAEFSVRYCTFSRNAKGCPKCSSSGYRPSEMGYFYIQTLDDKFIKFGVTNELPETRMKQHMQKSKFAHKLVYVKQSVDGWIPWELEKEIKRTYQCGVVDKSMLKDGYTETLHITDLDSIIKLADTY